MPPLQPPRHHHHLLHHHLLPTLTTATSPPPPSIFETATSPPPAPPAPCLRNGHVTTTSTSRPRHGHVTTIITSTFVTATSSRPTFNAAITTRDISSGISSRAGSFSLPQGIFFVFLFIYYFSLSYCKFE